MRDKGQAFLTDFALSMAIFGIIISAFFVPWNMMIETENRFSHSDDMKAKAERTVSIMVTSPGYPEDWEQNLSEPAILGLSTQKENVISMEKLEAFSNLSNAQKTSVLDSRGFSLNFRYPENSEVIKYSDSEVLGTEFLGKEPIAYIARGGSTFSSLEMLEELNSSTKEWYFYFPSEENQDDIDSLTAEKTYTNEGSGPKMFQRMISDAANRGFQRFKTGSKIKASLSISEVFEVDNDGNKGIFFRDQDGKLKLHNLENSMTQEIDPVNEVTRMGAVENFTSEEEELAFINGDSKLNFYSLEDNEVIETSIGAVDIGDSTTISGDKALFFIDDDNSLSYYIRGRGNFETSFSGSRVGGAGDIDGDDVSEIAFRDEDDKLAFYDPETETKQPTDQGVKDVGWIHERSVAVVSGNNENLGVWNSTDSSFENYRTKAGAVTDFRMHRGDSSIFYIDRQIDQDLARFNPETGLTEYLREGSEESIKAFGGGWEVKPDQTGRLISYRDASGYLSFYSVQKGFTMRSQVKAQDIGGGGDLDSDGNNELALVDSNGYLGYYDFQDGNKVMLEDSGSRIASGLVGMPADLEGDNTSEIAYRTVDDLLAYYDVEEEEVTVINSIGSIEDLGDSKDIDRDGNTEILYTKNGELKYYDPVSKENTGTNRLASGLGGAADLTGNPQKEIMYKDDNQYLSHINPSNFLKTQEAPKITNAGSLTQLRGDESFYGIVIDENNEFGYFDFSMNLTYNTVIAENAKVEADEVRNDARLREAVEKGMTYLHTRNDPSILTKIFNMDSQDPGSNKAKVQKVEPLLNPELSRGEEISFENVQTGFERTNTVFANSTQPPNSCLACKKTVGEGKVYYLADTDIGKKKASLADPETEVQEENVSKLKIGKEIPEEAENVVKADRYVTIKHSDGFENAEINYLLWK